MCMFISWIDLILFLRRLPGVGIYIVMVLEVFITCIKFFAFCFSLFIFAFGFTFYVLLRNQVPLFKLLSPTRLTLLFVSRNVMRCDNWFIASKV